MAYWSACCLRLIDKFLEKLKYPSECEILQRHNSGCGSIVFILIMSTNVILENALTEAWGAVGVGLCTVGQPFGYNGFFG